MYVGIETSDEEVKKKAHRSSEKNDTQIEKVNFLQKIGIDIKAMYIIGLPSDTEETYLKTLEFSKKFHQHMLNLVFSHHIRYTSIPEL